jgi:hypothetical protein
MLLFAVVCVHEAENSSRARPARLPKRQLSENVKIYRATISIPESSLKSISLFEREMLSTSFPLNLFLPHGHDSFS